LKSGRLLDRKFVWLFTAKYAVDVGGRTAKRLGYIDPVGHQAALGGKDTNVSGKGRCPWIVQEADADTWDRWNIYSNFTYVDATFGDALTLSSPFNPFANANGDIFVVPGDH
jgi:hypothetical protein